MSGPTRRRYASWTRAVAWSVWPGFSQAEPLRGQLAEAGIHQGQELIGRRGVAGLDGQEDLGGIGHGGVPRASPSLPKAPRHRAPSPGGIAEDGVNGMMA